MPYTLPAPGVVHLTIPREGWDAADRTACISALEASCAAGPTAVLLESEVERVSDEGPNMMLDVYVRHRDRIVFLGVTSRSTILHLTLAAFTAAARIRGLTFPIEVSDDLSALEHLARTLVTTARAR